MGLERFLQPWSGWAFRHIPANSPYDVLDFRFAGKGADNRWNERGQPTLYLAGDRGVAVAEFSRHMAEGRKLHSGELLVERELFRLAVKLTRVLDLRLPAVQEAISLRGAPHCLLERSLARATANYLRQSSTAQALLVPSMSFLDDPERFLLVLFLEKMPTESQQYILWARSEGSIRVQLAAPGETEAAERA